MWRFLVENKNDSNLENEMLQGFRSLESDMNMKLYCLQSDMEYILENLKKASKGQAEQDKNMMTDYCWMLEGYSAEFLQIQNKMFAETQNAPVQPVSL